MIWYDSMLLPYHSFLWWISWNEWDFTGNIDEYSEKITICDMDDIHLAELFSDLLLWPHWNPTDLGHHPMAELLSVLSWCFFYFTGVYGFISGEKLWLISKKWWNNSWWTIWSYMVIFSMDTWWTMGFDLMLNPWKLLQADPSWIHLWSITEVATGSTR